MPIQRRRTDGFSDDGLSYSVASDFDKQIGQALAAQEARLKDPRYIPGAQVERPDSPDILNRELIDPVLTAFGMDQDHSGRRYGRYDRPENASPFTAVKSGKETFVLDKRTGRAMPMVTPDPEAQAKEKSLELVPKNASATANWFQNSPLMRSEESQAISKLNQPGADPIDILGTQHPTLLANPPYATRYGPVYRSAMEKRQRAEKAKPKATADKTTPRVAERLKLANMLREPDIAPDTAERIRNRMAEIDAQFKIANDFLQQAGGDPKEAERLAREAGHEFQ